MKINVTFVSAGKRESRECEIINERVWGAKPFWFAVSQVDFVLCKLSAGEIAQLDLRSPQNGWFVMV